jgi:hypothetical protein
MRRAPTLLLFLVIFSCPSPSLFLRAQDEQNVNLNYLISDEEMLDVESMSLAQIQAFLSRGSLAQYRARDIDGVERSAAEMILNASSAFDISPKFLLVLLQREQSLVEDDSPSKDQLDWAMGYAICDDCSKSDPRLQKFRGFAAQVFYSAQRIRESYLSDLTRRGFTEAGVGPGIEAVIDGTLVMPVNNATASLYTYTPHLNGNKNFVAIWTRWFYSEYPTGALLQDETSGGIWLIQNGSRRPITSRAAFFSRFNPNTLVQVPPSALDAYPIGQAITFPNYSLLRSPRGTVYLIVDDTRRGFTSQEAFKTTGFSQDEIVDVSFEELKPYAEGDPITVSSVHPDGILLQDKTTGGVFYVENGFKRPIFSKEILVNRFAGRPIVPAELADLNAYERGEPITFQDGTLIASRGTAEVFVISEGARRHIADEATFVAYGWKWNQVVWTDERSVTIHPLSQPLTTALETLKKPSEIESAIN